MAVNNQHPKYTKFLPIWQKCDDAADGQEAIHAKKERYLPRLTDQTDQSYKSYLARATYYNATGRTISGLHGMIFRKPPVIDCPDSALSLLDDIDLHGNSLVDFSQELIHELLEVGRVGILLDHPQADTQGMTQADVSKLNLRPYMRKYDAENILNWKTGRVNNKHALIQVVLQECRVTDKNEFEQVTEPQYRVLDLKDGRYRQRVFIINDKGEDELLSESYPIMNGKFLSEIPFCFIGSQNLSEEPEEPPLLDLVNVNIAHYRVTADYEHGCHFTGLPTPIVTGYSNDSGEQLYIGSGSAWTFPDPQAKAFYLEFSGQGLSALENNLAQKEQQMAVLGARMLSADKKAVEAADTAAIHRAGENSVLATLAQNVSSGLNRCLKWFGDWIGASQEITIQLNRDFNAVPMTADQLTALVGAWQAGALSQESLFDALNAGELYTDGATFEDEQSKIKANPAPAPIAQKTKL